MHEPELTCGQEISASAEVPDALGALMRHVATNLRAHAAWVGADSAETRLEHDGMLAVARGYEEVAATAERLAATMRSLAPLHPAPHDPSKLDRTLLAEWMREKLKLQRRLAELLEANAQMMERSLASNA